MADEQITKVTVEIGGESFVAAIGEWWNAGRGDAPGLNGKIVGFSQDGGIVVLEDKDGGQCQLDATLLRHRASPP